MEGRAASSMDRKSAVIAMSCTRRILLEMKSNGWIRSKRLSAIRLSFFLTIALNSSFLLWAALSSIYMPLKPLPTPPSADKKNLCIIWRSFTNTALKYWLSNQLWLSFFLQTTVLFPAFNILTILFYKCQTKSLDEINILLKTILNN